jgi:Ca2+-dependent lipid-binding protein
MLVTVYDEDTFSDDVVGSASIELRKYIDNPI